MNNRYFIAFSYSGKAYCGWQRQPNGLSVQEVMEKCMSLKTGSKVELLAAGRTDAGVNAKCMTAHFDFEGEWDNKLNDKLNAFLPADIAILNVSRVKNEAHARFSALSRSYEYHIILEKNPFLTEFAWYIHKMPDVEAMKSALSALFRFSEFTSFSKMHSDNKTDICKILKADICLKENNLLVFSITADRFLRNMVRAITGTLVDVGLGKISPERFSEIIAAKDRSLASMSAPAQGLFFVKANYDEDVFI